MSYAKAMKAARIERKAWDKVAAMQARAATFPERSDLGVRATVLRGRARRISRSMD